jgi:hypothetical protein
MAWTFDGKEIAWVVDSKYVQKDGTVELDCVAEGNLVVEDVFSSDGMELRQCKFNGEKVVLGTTNFIAQSGDTLWIQKTNEPDSNNVITAQDMLLFYGNTFREALDFNENCNEVNVQISPVELTALLEEGENSIEISIQNNCGNNIGCSPFVITLFHGNDPRDEIEAWKKYEASVSNNVISLRGNRILQGSRTVSYELKDGNYSYNAILDKVLFTEDSLSNKAIFYSLTFKIGSAVFKDKYGKCYPIIDFASNLMYSEFLDVPIDPNNPNHTLGRNLGHVILSEPFADLMLAIRKVDIYGGGIDLPSWISVNGVKKYWHYRASDATEKLTFYLSNTYQLDIESPNYIDEQGIYFGSAIKAICTDIIVDTMGIPASIKMSSVISLASLEGYSGAVFTFRANLLVADALNTIPTEFIEGEEIKFYLSGELLGSSLTDNNGLAELTGVINKDPGIYTIQAVFSENDYYTGSAYTNSLIIKSPPSKEVYSGQTIIKAFAHRVSHKGEDDHFGPFAYDWDGRGKVYLLTPLNGYQIENLSYADDQLYARTSKGEVNHRYDVDNCKKGVIAPGPPLNITSILTKGQNSITIGARDICGGWIGIGYDLAIVQILANGTYGGGGTGIPPKVVTTPPYVVPSSGSGASSSGVKKQVEKFINYTSPWEHYPNMDYYYWSDGTNKTYGLLSRERYGKEIGILNIRESHLIHRVELLLSGCWPPVTVYCNGQSQGVGKFHDGKPRGLEIHEFNIAPTNKITIKSGVHLYGDNLKVNHGIDIASMNLFYYVEE